MKTTGGTMRVEIANVKLDVPIFGDPETTLEIAKKVSDRILDIEKRSNRIDTQAFALQAAMEFAAELVLAQADSNDDARDTARALETVSQLLNDLINRFNESKSDS